MRTNIDDLKAIALKDTAKVYQTITQLKYQFESAWEDVSLISLPNNVRGIENVCIAGMGGSALAGRIIQSLSPAYMTVPVVVVSNYRLPNFVSQKTLVIISSYSGTTEESVSCLLDAYKRHAQIVTISNGGQVEDLSRKHSLNHYSLNSRFNPSNLPRLAMFTSLGAHLSLLNRFTLLNDPQFSLSKAINIIGKVINHSQAEIPTNDNPSKILSHALVNKSIILIGANHLSGSLHAAKNLFNETSKSFSVSFELPELNHHLLEGLEYPKEQKHISHVLLLNSHLYPDIIQKRLNLTKDVLNQIGYTTTVIKPESETILEQVLETASFFHFVSYYLAIINEVDPGAIPWVNYFKDHLHQ